MTSIVGGVGKEVLKLGRTVRLLCSSSLSNYNPRQCSGARHISASSKVMKILTESTTIVQDGTTIGELPILIRRATRDTYPFTSHSYCGENIRAETEFDMTFKDMLENCDSVSDVFNLLEVPSDKVQGHCAVYALQRLHVLMSLNSDWKQIHSFIRRAVIGELYHIVERDVRLLSNFSLVTLVDCYFAAEGFSVTCSEAVHKEMSHRLVEGLFSVEELLSLIHSLRTGIRNTSTTTRCDIEQSFDRNPSYVSEDVSELLSAYSPEKMDESSQSFNVDFHAAESQKYQELLQNVWVHLASRCHDMDENTIPWTMQLLPSSKKMFVPLLDKALTDVWQMLSAETAGMCLDNLVRLRSHNSSMMAKLGHYAVLNIHLMTPSVLLSYLRAFLHFSVADRNLIHVIQKCVKMSKDNTPTDLLALCVEYLRSCKHVSPIVMDVAAKHFTQHWESYTPLEIYAVLRCFGQLRYLPPEPQDFISKSEVCLHKRFNVMDEIHFIEVLASFSFVTALPKTFHKRISSEYFFKKVGALKNPTRTRALMWLKMLKHSMVMESYHTNIEARRSWVLKGKKKWSVYLYRDPDRFYICILQSALDRLFGPAYHHVIPFYSCCALYVDSKGMLIKIDKDENGCSAPVEVPAQRLAIVLRSERHVTSNTKRLLGAEQQRMDHLKKLEYEPIAIRSTDFISQASVGVLQSHLKNFVDFDNSDVVDLKKQRLKDVEEICRQNYIQDEEEDEGEVREIVLEDLIESLHNLEKRNIGKGLTANDEDRK